MTETTETPETQEQPTETPEVEAKAEGEETQPETPAEEPAKDEAKADEPEAEDADAPAGETKEGKHKRLGGWQRKLERLERQNAQLLEALTAQRSGPATTEAPKEKSAEDKAAEYVDSLVEKRLAARDAQQRQQATQAEFHRRTEEVRAANPDFDDVMMSAEVPVSPALGQALLTSEHGPAIMYRLAKNPAELARLSALPPLDAAREVGRLEAQVASGTSAPLKPRPAARPPPPPSPVAKGSPTSRDIESLSISDYKRAFRAKAR